MPKCHRTENSLSSAVVNIERQFAQPAALRLVQRALIPAGGMLVLTAFCLLGSKDAWEFAREHGPMENLQAAFLLVAVVVLVCQVQNEKASATRILRALMAWGYFIFLLREYDVRPFEVKWLTVLLSGVVRNTWVALGSLLLAVWAFRELRGVIAAARSWLTTFPATLLAASAVFWVLGAVMESFGSLGEATSMFLEELMETNGAWLMLLAAMYAGSVQRSEPNSLSLRRNRTPSERVF